MNPLPEHSLAFDLFTLIDDEFAPSTIQVLLLVLCALSGRTGNPVSARTTGNGRSHTAAALFIEKLLGPQDVAYFTSATEAGIVSLGKSSGPRALIYEGPLTDLNLRRALLRLSQRKPLRTLDAPLGQQERFRKFDDPAAVILLDTDEANDAGQFAASLPIALIDTPVIRRQDGERRLRPFMTGGPDSLHAVARTIENLHGRLTALRWDCEVRLDHAAQTLVHASHPHDVIRIEQLTSLVAVWTVLVQEPTLHATFSADEASVQWIVQLIEAVNAGDERQCVPAPAQRFLESLQRYVIKRLPEVKRLQRDTAANAGVIPLDVTFSRIDLAADDRFKPLSGDRIDHLLRVLEQRGMVEKNGHEQRRRMWRLTPWGLDYRRESLSERLRGLWSGSSSAPLGSNPSATPAEAGPTQAGPVVPGNGSSAASGNHTQLTSDKEEPHDE